MHPNVERFADKVTNYMEGNHPHPMGSFYTAVLANDLVDAFKYADSTNQYLLHEYATWMYNNLPGRSGDPTRDIWGSYTAIENTIRRQQDRMRETRLHQIPPEQDG